jgi:hypothetical protein
MIMPFQSGAYTHMIMQQCALITKITLERESGLDDMQSFRAFKMIVAAVTPTLAQNRFVIIKLFAALSAFTVLMKFNKFSSRFASYT